MKNNAVAIITARGGSKRIPKKNIKDFRGKPIIAYSIEAAIRSGVFDDVMVSTDDEEIASIAKYYGASIPFMRSEETSNDYATTSDVLKEVIREYTKRGKLFKYACCIYPTAPFVTAERIRDCFEMISSCEADTFIPVVKFSYPPQRSFVKRGEYIEFKNPEYMSSRSQDLETLYHDAGQFYFFKIDSFMSNGSLLLGKIKPVLLPEIEVQDIDDESDWKLAELKHAIINGNG